MIILLRILIFFLIGYFISFRPSSIFAKFYKNPNPILSSSLSSWDYRYVASPSVIYDTDFKIWYFGSNGSYRRIGYATSEDGINWLKSNNYVLEAIFDGINFNVHDPVVIKNGINYLMWYAESDSFINNIHINYSKSIDGLNWSEKYQNIVTPFYSWENQQNKGVSYPFVLYDKSVYKMWYGAFGDYNGKTSWRIGYATSTDGISWIKHPVPVLEADSPWENRSGGGGIGNPSVIFDGTNYQMWYHADRDIGHAISPDGIVWTKDPDNPVLSPTENDTEAFDFRRVMDPSVIVKDGIYYLYYTGEGKNHIWQIGLATSADLSVTPAITPTLTPTPTETPSPTPTLTPAVTLTPAFTTIPTFTPASTPALSLTLTPTVTPTFTPTPTPTPLNAETPTPSPAFTPIPQPNGFSPVIIIPGIGASWNPAALFSCNLADRGVWKMGPYVSLYNRLIKTLTENTGLRLDRDVYVYNYDWRQTLEQQSSHFKKYIDKVLSGKPSGTKVRLVGHSLGGLVIRSYLKDYQNDNHVWKAITVGTPHEGTVLAYPLWEKGDLWTGDPLIKVAVNSYLGQCRMHAISSAKTKTSLINFPSKREIVQYTVPLVRQLLPTFEFLRKKGTLIKIREMFAQNDWLTKYPLPDDFYNTTLGTLSGETVPTLRFLDIIEADKQDKTKGDWTDGKPVANWYDVHGDGTVLTSSSSITGAYNDTFTSFALSV